MSLYRTLKNTGKTTIMAGALTALLSGCSQPTLEQNKDLTGDKIPDAIVKIAYGPQSGTWLFIGQKDGSFERAKKYSQVGVEFFRTSDGTTYFFDGKFYRHAPKQK